MIVLYALLFPIICLIPGVAWAGMGCRTPPYISTLCGATAIPLIIYFFGIKSAKRQLQSGDIDVCNRSWFKLVLWTAPSVHVGAVVLTALAHFMFGSLPIGWDDRMKCSYGTFNQNYAVQYMAKYPIGFLMLLAVVLSVVALRQPSKKLFVVVAIPCVLVLFSVAWLAETWPGCVQMSAFNISE